MNRFQASTEVLLALKTSAKQLHEFLLSKGYLRNIFSDCTKGITTPLGIRGGQLVITKGVYGFFHENSHQMVKSGQGRLMTRHSGNISDRGQGTTRVAFLLNHLHPNNFQPIENFIKEALQKLKEINSDLARLIQFYEEDSCFQLGLPHVQNLLQLIEYALAMQYNESTESIESLYKVPEDVEFAAYALQAVP